VADPDIAVLAGTNGAGKSTIGGELLRQAGVPYFNPDEVAREILDENPGLTLNEATVRERFANSRLNLIRLMPRLTELKVFDNSAQADPNLGHSPEPGLLLHLRKGDVVGPSRAAMRRTPEWAKPVIEAALSIGERPSRGM